MNEFLEYTISTKKEIRNFCIIIYYNIVMFINTNPVAE